MIKLIGVNKVYDTGVQALSNINCHIDPGEFVYLIGPTGAGKSTFIKLLYREEVASSGKVLIAGVDVSRLRNSKIPYFRRSIGVVFQNFRLLPKKNVYENVAFALEVTDTKKRDIRGRVKKTLELVGLEEKANSFPNQLSGGQQQRVAIARAIVNDPKVLIADEPTGNLDPETSEEILNVLERVNATGTTVVVVTHDSNLVEKYKKRTILIEHGCLTSDTSLGGYSHD